MSTDRNLHVGILAVQMNFATRDELVLAMKDWDHQKERPLAELLSLPLERRQLLESCVDEHLKLHDRQLHSTQSAPVHEILQAIPDLDLQASTGLPASASSRSLNSTIHYSAARIGSRYRILRPHARGGLGEVFIAEDTELHREVALKEILAHHAGSTTSRGRFVLEAEVTGKLEHPNIVPVYGLGTYADGRPFYAMRFIRGDSLKEAIDRFHAPKQNAAGSHSSSERNLAFRNLLHRFVEVCNAIAFAHSRGILHRDLKPANIMLGEYGETLVVDWGLAKSLTSRDREATGSDEPARSATSGSSVETQAGTTVGTPPFMSPEQAAGRLGELGPASDVYSLGATLYVILTGKAAFEGEIGDVMRKIEAGDFASPRQVRPEVPAALNAIVLKAMAKKPADRYATATLLAEEIEHFLADEPVNAHREPFASRARRWGRKHPGAAASLAAAVLVGLLGLAAGLFFVNAEKNRTEKARQGEAEQRTLAQTNETAALAARDQARERYQVALDAFNDMVFGIQRKLETLPGTQDLRKDLLENARRGLKRLLVKAEKQGHPDSALIWSYLGMGDVERMLGNTANAQSEYRAGHELARTLAQADPANAVAQRDLSVSFNKLGDVALLLGQSAAARDYYERGMELSRRLANTQPDDVNTVRDLHVSYSKLGDLSVAAGEAATAKKYAELALAAAQRLFDLEPESSHTHRGLSVSYERLGDASMQLGRTEDALGYYEKSLEWCQRLADADPKNVANQRDLGVSFNKLGDAALGASRLKAAQDYYERGMTVSQRLADADPKNVEFQRDLAVSYNKLGNASLQSNQATAALDQFSKGLTVSQRLAEADPKNAEIQRDLLISFLKIGRTHEATGDHALAIDWYRKALAVAERSPVAGFFKDDVAWLTKQIAGCEAALKKAPRKP